MTSSRFGYADVIPVNPHTMASDLPTLPANLCSLLRGTEFARFANNLTFLAGTEIEEKSFAAAGDPALLQTMLHIEKKRFQEN